MFCKNCGFQLKDTAKFCPKCGTANTPPPIPPQPNNFTQQPNNFAHQPSNFTQQPNNFAHQPSNFTQQPNNFAHQPNNFTQQPNNFAHQPNNFAQQPNNFAHQPNNFAPQQNSSFSPNAQSTAVKTKKPLIIVGVGIVILIVIIIAFCIGFTGFGGVSGGSKGGYKKATEAAEAGLIALYTRDAAAMMKSWPEEAKEYWEDAANLTEEQLQERMQSRMDNNRFFSMYGDNISAIVDDNSDPVSNIEVIQNVNSILDNYGITADDAIWFAGCTLVSDDEEKGSFFDAYVYKYNGRWYSLFPEQSLGG